jgi:hypothetical protein
MYAVLTGKAIRLQIDLTGFTCSAAQTTVSCVQSIRECKIHLSYLKVRHDNAQRRRVSLRADEAQGSDLIKRKEVLAVTATRHASLCSILPLLSLPCVWNACWCRQGSSMASQETVCADTSLVHRAGMLTSPQRLWPLLLTACNTPTIFKRGTVMFSLAWHASLHICKMRIHGKATMLESKGQNA